MIIDEKLSEQYFEALVVKREADKSFSYKIEKRQLSQLPQGEVLVRVHFSSINFKDCMSCQGHPAITRRFPHTPGIDASGIVESSCSNKFKKGDKVILLSSNIGMSKPGGFGQYISSPASSLMKVEDLNLSLEEFMAFGIAGYTAALSVNSIVNNYSQLTNKRAVVTGATGGVGCFAVALLSGLGCHVTAVTGKMKSENFLISLGAKEVIDRQQFIEDDNGQNLLKSKWDIAVDVAGGQLLSSLLKQMNSNGIVIATGMVNDTSFNSSVLPFILRGVKLIGINAENIGARERNFIWQKISSSWKPPQLDSMYQVVSLQDLPRVIDDVIKGECVGRTVIDLR